MRNSLELQDLTSTQQDAVQHILQGGRHLVTLVDDVLDITQMHGQHLDLAIEAVGTDRLLAECVQQMTPLAIDRDIQLHYQPQDATEVLIQADPERLTQVVTNLLSNAIKYNRPGGRVDITYQVSDTSHNLDITVADTGRGIASHDLPRLFLPFDRIDADANHIQGTGLGVALCRDLMTTRPT